ncbi:STAS/SEC14 domain-containing protein [Pleionea litopenaei]|uniref:STAS/SEC14 domain-containing protein n=1 Tax=Pleionea litopenaei TaxID=3070815 RepID=A0AA51X769_9GAMM|nr:STAS/SEC14 domain-containing protein [Pleionea sp. HL-JVS1]WMS88012.1 STAS/SEC14 domain-containing protein [Pleionea sp. HL-JVS1]
MEILTHGLLVGIQRFNQEVFITIKATGKLTHEDYETITPLIENTLSSVEHPNVKMFFDGSEFDGWDLRAAWDDLKLGLKHNKEFSKIAILGNSRWLELGTKVSAWFVSGEAKYFTDKEQALTWLEGK